MKDNEMSKYARGDHVEASAEAGIAPFWQRLNSFFLFPFQAEPLIYGAVLSLCSLLILMGSVFAVVTVLLLSLVVTRYAFKVSALASQGVTHSADYRGSQMDEAWTSLPWKFLGVLLVHGFVIGWLTHASPALGLVANLLSSFVIPATWMVLITTCSLRAAINPFEVLATVAGVGKSYLLLCLFLFLLLQGMPIAASLLMRVVNGALLVPLLCAVVIYFTWVMAALIGYVMYQHHAALDIAPIRSPDQQGAGDERASVDALDRSRDAEVARLVQDGDMAEALSTAREWQRLAYDSLPDQRRYHRLLKLVERPADLAAHGQTFIRLLLRQQCEAEAMEVWASCRKRVPDFKLDSAEDTLAVARHAWRSMNGRHVVLLLQGFERQFPADERVPLALEMMVRAFRQGLDDPHSAVRVYLRMKARFPAHASTKEAAWILREELGEVAAAG